MARGGPRIRDEGIAVSGFSEIQKALATIDKGIQRELTKRLRKVGHGVALTAGRNVTSRTGRHSGQRIERSIKVAVNRNSASVYSTAPQGGVQNVGGRVGRHHATLIKRSDVSQYMTKAVSSSRDEVTQDLEGLLDWLTEEFGK